MLPSMTESFQKESTPEGIFFLEKICFLFKMGRTAENENGGVALCEIDLTPLK